jgi:hypothetical protein
MSTIARCQCYFASASALPVQVFCQCQCQIQAIKSFNLLNSYFAILNIQILVGKKLPGPRVIDQEYQLPDVSVECQRCQEPVSMPVPVDYHHQMPSRSLKNQLLVMPI